MSLSVITLITVLLVLNGLFVGDFAARRGNENRSNRCADVHRRPKPEGEDQDLQLQSANAVPADPGSGPGPQSP